MRGSSRTIEIGKRAFYEQLDIPIEAAYAHAKEVMARNAAEPDAQEGIGAFLDNGRLMVDPAAYVRKRSTAIPVPSSFPRSR